MEKYNIDESFGTIVHWAERALINRLNHNFRAGGMDITTEQWRLLANVWNLEGQNQQELAAVTRKDKTGITRIIKGLEKRDLVVRIPDRTDSRINLLYLTRKGRESIERLIRMASRTLEEAKANIPEDEIRICEKVLRRVTRNLSEDIEETDR